MCPCHVVMSILLLDMNVLPICLVNAAGLGR